MRSSSNMWVLSLTSPIGAFGTSIWSLLLPLYLVSLGVDLQSLGFFYSVIAAVSALSLVVAGHINDRIGDKASIVLSGFVSGVTVTFMAFTANFFALLLLLSVRSASSGLGSISRPTMIARSTIIDKRPESLAIYHSISNTVSLISPIVGGIALYLHDFRILFLFGGVLIFITVLLRFLLLKESGLKNLDKLRPSFKSNLRYFFSERKLRPILLFLSGRGFLVSMTSYLIPIFAAIILGLPAYVIGLIFSAGILIGIVLSVPGARLSERYGVSLVTMVVTLIAVSFEVLFASIVILKLPITIAAFVTMGLYGGLLSMCAPLRRSWLYEASPSASMATISGTSASMTATVSLVAPALGSYLFLMAPSIPFYFEAGVTLLIAIVVWKVYKPNRVQNS